HGCDADDARAALEGVQVALQRAHCLDVAGCSTQRGQGMITGIQQLAAFFGEEFDQFGIEARDVQVTFRLCIVREWRQCRSGDFLLGFRTCDRETFLLGALCGDAFALGLLGGDPVAFGLFCRKARSFRLFRSDAFAFGLLGRHALLLGLFRGNTFALGLFGRDAFLFGLFRGSALALSLLSGDALLLGLFCGKTFVFDLFGEALLFRLFGRDAFAL